MTRILSALVVFIACLFLDAAHGAEAPWELLKEAKGVQLFSRAVEGSQLLEYEAVAEIPASLDVLGAVLDDIPNYPQWMSKCREASVLSELDSRTLMIYFVQTLPWPIACRDVVLKASTTKDKAKGRMEVLLRDIPDAQGPSHEKRVRMNRFSGRIFLEETGQSRTRVFYRIQADPAVSLPPSGINAVASNIPYETLLGMKEMARMEKYMEAARKI